MRTYSLVFFAFFQFLLVLDQASELMPSDPVGRVNRNSAGITPAKIVFKSADGGRTWQDITEGLPDNSGQEGFMIGGGFATNDGFYLRAGDGLFFNKRNSSAPNWSKEILSDNRVGIFPSKTGMLAFNYNDGQVLQAINGKKDWLPVYQNFQRKDVLTFFETDKGTAFIGTNTGLFKFVDAEKAWKQVFAGSKGVRKLAESGGVLMAVTQKGIMRSTDNGDHWNLVTDEGDHGMDVQRINGGFAAITESTERRFRVRTSHDGGITWQFIDDGLPVYVFNIVQVGANLFCSHQNGISGSSDNGKTWKLLLPSIDKDVFNLSVSGNVIYATRNVGGC
ncbi:glycoside hydrolase [Fulvivirgaceae bacterium PWU4]|uniref:Glycoside hydrolase n=1 Tax=Chryseosolibacter histidini TaxID=2782349 RepID=A0AAP2DIB8_9BACT|nr:exo-alpha-sialidase [Chryseosolibacter histidini]MBT1695547.1 glycoside hydrolase [Chryseosolibacter histidini]